MKSLEMKPELGLDMDAVPTSSFPSFYVSDEQMAEIADWEIGEEYTFTVSVRMKYKMQEATVDGTDTDGTLEVLAYEVQ